MDLFKSYELKAKRNVVTAILRGVLGDEFDQMLENDDFEGVIAKLGNDGSVHTILEDAQRRLKLDIDKHEMRISMYDAKTPKHVIETSKEELAKEKKNLDDLKKKISTFHGRHAVGTLPEECPICFENLDIVPTRGTDPRNLCIAHMSCMNVYHAGCIGDYMKADKTAVCPTCRGELSQDNLKPTYDINGYNLEQQQQMSYMKPKIDDFAIDTEKEYESKMDALKAALGPMQRMHNGVLSWFRRQRILLFLELKNEDGDKLDEVVKFCQTNGYNVMLPFKPEPNISKLYLRFPSVVYNGVNQVL
jgi:hypothetical protein